ncbi:MAG: penicillin acylase family protein [Pseudomonadota bacterium]
MLPLRNSDGEFRLGVLAASGLAILALLIVVSLPIIASQLGGYQTSGEMRLAQLDEPVEIIRDEKGMPYIYAQSARDAFRAQGFIAAQDRLLQLELTKYAAHGRLSELFGEATFEMDRSARVLGFRRISQAHWEALNTENKEMITDYTDGLNAYIRDYERDHPFEFRALGLRPAQWSEADIVSTVLYYAWSNSANFNTELLAQALSERLGAENAAQIRPLVINPEVGYAVEGAPVVVDPIGLDGADLRGARHDPSLEGQGGSNAWAVAGWRSPNGAAVVANDPHLDARRLPGPWHAVGLITPEFRAVGVDAGMPGLVVGRNEHVAWGVTNGYADVVDLYVESEDPNDPTRYLEDDASLPFEIIEETIEIKDAEPVTLIIRLTRRGPVISDHGMALASNKLISVRWAVAEFPQPDLGIRGALEAQNLDALIAAWDRHRMLGFTLALGDKAGRVARLGTGAVPRRVIGDGGAPTPASAVDTWDGLIPIGEMPRQIDPEVGWAGSANHFIAPEEYPYPYSTYSSATYRFERLAQLLSGEDVVSIDDHIAAQRDVFNPFAQSMAPLMAQAIADDPETAHLADILGAWDYEDTPDSVAATIFQSMHRHFARRVFGDEVGPDLLEPFFYTWYGWQQRLHHWALDPTQAHTWFDDQRTEAVEGRDDMFRAAAKDAIEELTAMRGADTDRWRWGDVRAMRWVAPLSQDGFIGDLTGNFDMPVGGSGETLNRSMYRFSQEGFDPSWTASLRMVADLGDDEKVRAVLAGGVVGRSFNAHLADQARALEENTPVYWWFSDERIQENAKTRLTLSP